MDPEKESNPASKETVTGEEMLKEFNLLIQAIGQATGEDFRARLLEYSQSVLQEQKQETK